MHCEALGLLFSTYRNIQNVEVEDLCDDPDVLLGINGTQHSLLRLWNSKEGVEL